jgi:hypothetical protein
MPLVNFKSTTPGNAFILAALASAITITLAMYGKEQADVWFNPDPPKSPPRLSAYLISFAVAFLAALGSFWLMHFIFGFGGGMLVNMAS